MIKQVSVFLENKKGRLSEALEILHKNDINLRSLTIAETTDYGILRLIPNKPELAAAKLKEAGFVVNQTKVLAIEVNDSPGSMLTVIKGLSMSDIDIEYSYCCLPVHEHKVVIILKVSDSEKAIELLRQSSCAKLIEAEAFA